MHFRSHDLLWMLNSNGKFELSTLSQFCSQTRKLIVRIKSDKRKIYTYIHLYIYMYIYMILYVYLVFLYVFQVLAEKKDGVGDGTFLSLVPPVATSTANTKSEACLIHFQVRICSNILYNLPIGP